MNLGDLRDGLCSLLRHRLGPGILADDFGNLSVENPRPRHGHRNRCELGIEFARGAYLSYTAALFGPPVDFLAIRIGRYAAWIFVARMVPETKGKTLEQIEASLENCGPRERSLNSVGPSFRGTRFSRA